MISNSGVRVRAWKIAPAARSRSTIGSSRSGTLSCMSSEPFVERLPGDRGLVLDGDGESLERSRVAPCVPFSGGARGGPRLLDVLIAERVDNRLSYFDPVEGRLQVVARRDAPSRNARSVSTADNSSRTLMEPPIRVWWFSGKRCIKARL